MEHLTSAAASIVGVRSSVAEWTNTTSNPSLPYDFCTDGLGMGVPLRDLVVIRGGIPDDLKGRQQTHAVTNVRTIALYRKKLSGVGFRLARSATPPWIRFPVGSSQVSQQE